MMTSSDLLPSGVDDGLQANPWRGNANLAPPPVSTSPQSTASMPAMPSAVPHRAMSSPTNPMHTLPRLHPSSSPQLKPGSLPAHHAQTLQPRRHASAMQAHKLVHGHANKQHRPRSLFERTQTTRLPLVQGNEQEAMAWRNEAVGDTPLDKTIHAIGMGRYQWALLVLAGCGWAADNMWLQGVAIILPRIQDQFGTSDRWIGLVSSSTFAGMMVGALSWGGLSDAYGRRPAFNLTLLITAVFGMLSAFAGSFEVLCLCLFLLGTGVGGSMPTDGTLFLENLPKNKQYLLTALSVFFAMGSVASSVLGLAILPAFSCPEPSPGGGGPKCDVDTQNRGWRYLLGCLAVLTTLFVLARVVFFRLFESPKYLVAAGRPQEARVVLQRIAAYNGSPLPVGLADVRDTREAFGEPVADANVGPGAGAAPSRRRSPLMSRPTGYSAVPTSEEARAAPTVVAAKSGPASPTMAADGGEDDEDEDAEDAYRGAQRAASGASCNGVVDRLVSCLPASVRDGAEEARVRYAELLRPPWMRTTLLVFAIWTLFSLAFTTFNVFLSKFLEARLGSASRLAVMQDYVLYAVASLPGSVVGAWMIETRLGRIKTMALATSLLSASMLGFSTAATRWPLVGWTCAVSVTSSTAYAAIYGYTPEAFETRLRGTACGTASALSRLAGIVAPVGAGALFEVAESLPLVVAFAVLVATAAAMLALPIETRGRREGEGAAEAEAEAREADHGDDEEEEPTTAVGHGVA